MTTGLSQNLTVLDTNSTLLIYLPEPADLPQPTKSQLNLRLAISRGPQWPSG